MTVEFPAHAANPHFDVRDDELWVGGRRLTEVVAAAGGTPLFVYDRRVIADRVAALRTALPAPVQLHYAVKANPHPAVVHCLSRLVDGLDVASAGELRLALGTATAPAHISFAGPGKRRSELEAAVAAGIVVNVESENELAALADIGARSGLRPAVAIRVNPPFELRASGMKMGGGAQQFGIDAERVPELLRGMRRLAVDFVGFQIYSGSQNLRVEAICEAQLRTTELAAELAADAPAPVRVLNIGGGFGIPYFPGDAHLDLAPIGVHLATVLAQTQRALPEARVVVELGRYLVGEAGLYVCRVVDRKLSRGRVFLVTDGGLHHHLAASGNLGQVLRRNFPVCIGTAVRGAEREVVSVVGPLCTPLDLLADRLEMARADVGDLVVVFQSGAYGATASPTAFLGHPPPLELLL